MNEIPPDTSRRPMKNRMLFVWGIVLMLSCFGVMLAWSSNVVNRAPQVQQIQDDLSRSMLLWQKASIHDYLVTVNIAGYLALPTPNPNCTYIANIEVVLTVTNEKVTAASIYPECLSAYDNMTVENMYKRLDSSLKSSASRLDVKFDSRFGYITYYLIQISPDQHPLVLRFTNLTRIDK